MTTPGRSTRRRVAITGLGLVTPVGPANGDLASTWNSLIEGKSGVGPITRFDCAPFSVKIAAELKGFTPEKWVSTKEVRKMGLFIQYGVAAGLEALKDAGLSGKFGVEGNAAKVNPNRVGVSIA